MSQRNCLGIEKHCSIFQVDPSGSGSIPAGVAAKFLKKSGLSDIILSRVNIQIKISLRV
jgi:hypothetical protein